MTQLVLLPAEKNVIGCFSWKWKSKARSHFNIFATLTLQVLEEWHVQSRLFVKLYVHSHVIFTQLSPGKNDVNKEKISSVRCNEEKPGTYILWWLFQGALQGAFIITTHWQIPQKTQQSFIRRGSKPLPFYKLFFDRKRFSPRIPSIKKWYPFQTHKSLKQKVFLTCHSHKIHAQLALFDNFPDQNDRLSEP